jgi:hypothetical protein
MIISLTTRKGGGVQDMREQMMMRVKWSCSLRGSLLSALLLLVLAALAKAQQAPTTRTNPTEGKYIYVQFVVLRVEVLRLT